MDSRSDHTLLKATAVFTTLWLAIAAGAAIGMYLFTIPIIKNGGGSSRVMLRQFSHQISLGFQYMQRSSYAHTVLLAILTAYTYFVLSSGYNAGTNAWKYFGAAFLVNLQGAWYEVVFIFPTNDRLKAIEDRLKSKNDSAEDERAKPEVLGLLERWRRRHTIRMVIPLVAAALSFSAFELGAR